ncbi:hypothetical protein Tco_0170969, partial [Tanacetum coccineum]
ANTASTSGSGALPGNTVTNPKEDLKGVTTRSGVAYQGPPIPTSSVVKPIPEVTISRGFRNKNLVFKTPFRTTTV